MSPRVAFALNFFLPCVGYFVIGQWKKGLAFLLIAAAVTTVTLGYGLPVIALLGAIDAAMQARRLTRGFSIRQWSFFAQG